MNTSAVSDPFSTDPYYVAAYAYDCVVAFAIAFSRSIDFSDGAEVAARFREARFDGATGSVEFDDRGDRDNSTINCTSPEIVSVAWCRTLHTASFAAVEFTVCVLDSHHADVLDNWVRTGDTINSVIIATKTLGQPSTESGTAIKWMGTTDSTPPTDQTMQSRVAHLGMIFPFTNVGVELEGIIWKQLVCGAKLAVSHVNAGNETVVPGLTGLVTNLQRLDSSIYDTGCALVGLKTLDLLVALAAIDRLITARTGMSALAARR